MDERGNLAGARLGGRVRGLGLRQTEPARRAPREEMDADRRLPWRWQNWKAGEMECQGETLCGASSVGVSGNVSTL